MDTGGTAVFCIRFWLCFGGFFASQLYPSSAIIQDIQNKYMKTRYELDKICKNLY